MSLPVSKRVIVEPFHAARGGMSRVALETGRIGYRLETHLTTSMAVRQHRRNSPKGVLFANPANPTGASIPYVIWPIWFGWEKS